MNSAAVNVTDLILAAADDCIPNFVVKKKLNPPWITREVLKLVKTKRKLWGWANFVRDLNNLDPKLRNL